MMNVKISENEPIRLEMNDGWPSEELMLDINVDSYMYGVYVSTCSISTYPRVPVSGT
jgi:hypothetical protein